MWEHFKIYDIQNNASPCKRKTDESKDMGGGGRKCKGIKNIITKTYLLKNIGNIFVKLMWNPNNNVSCPVVLLRRKVLLLSWANWTRIRVSKRGKKNTLLTRAVHFFVYVLFGHNRLIYQFVSLDTALLCNRSVVPKVCSGKLKNPRSVPGGSVDTFL
jgi:hypothetical protein